MNRTERLYALAEALRARAPRPLRADDLAERFGVSRRTIERDLLALQEAGVPIWTRRGPHGGYGVDRDTTLPPLNLTPAEAAAIATALAGGGPTPFAGAGRAALRKLAGVMASGSKAAGARLVSQVRVLPGPAAAGARRAAGAVAPGAGPDAEAAGAGVADALQRALVESVAVELAYRDVDGRATLRVVEPAGLFSTPHGWYLAAWCRLRQAPRAFRLDRIARVSLTAESVVPRSLDAVLADLPYDLAEPALM